jgi:hypothetical protein
MFLSNFPRVQIGSSSEDAADDNDDDFEPGGKAKGAKKQRQRNSLQPLQSRPGSTAEIPSSVVKFTNCVVNPRIMCKEIQQFLERAGLNSSIYEFSTEIQNSKNGVIVMCDTGFVLKHDPKQRRTQAVPHEFVFDDISCIKSVKGDAAKGNTELRHVCFQTTQGLVFALDIECATGDYSRFRT